MPSITRGTGWLLVGVVLGPTSCARDAVSPYPGRGRVVVGSSSVEIRSRPHSIQTVVF